MGASYDDLVAVAKATESLGFAGFFRSDHYLAMSGDGGVGPTDAWTTLAGLARDTSTVRLGTLMSAATFRLPGPLAIQVAGVDGMSGGRVELGLGAGWFEREHTAYGIPFPPLGERFDRLEEQLAIVTGLWRTPVGQTFSHDGSHYTLEESTALAKPVQPGGVPIIIGGTGKRRTPALAAQYAAEFNVINESVETTRKTFRRTAAACADVGRDTALRYSIALAICLGKDHAVLRRRTANTGLDPEWLHSTGLVGSADQIVDLIGQYGAVGASRVYLQTLDLRDIDHLEDIAANVLPQVKGPAASIGDT
jgi:F420-dependent oxidoreductase-like protein